MKPVIVEGVLADIDGTRAGQVLIEGGTIAAVGRGLGRAAYTFDDGCLIFAGMGDVHIHAREDVTGRENYKETFATAAAAALHGGVLHVADMPNNPAAPVDDASYAAKEALLTAAALPVAFTLYGGIGPGTRPLRALWRLYTRVGLPALGRLVSSAWVDVGRFLGPNIGEFHAREPDLPALWQAAGIRDARELRPSFGAGLVMWGVRGGDVGA